MRYNQTILQMCYAVSVGRIVRHSLTSSNQCHYSNQKDTGNVTVQVLDTSSNETVWNHSYNKSTNFKIDLTDLKADKEYLLKITTVQSKK